MINTLITRIAQGYRTIGYPRKNPVLPELFRGVPRIDRRNCQGTCRQCIEACPTGAISGTGKAISIDLGRCIFCTTCSAVCPTKSVSFTRDHRLACSKRDDLIVGEESFVPTARLDDEKRKIFKRSLKLRQVSAGGCNACEADINVLSTIVFDLGRFGIQVVASPRHADGILVTGPVTENMRIGLLKTYEAVPDPKIVIAVGTCAISGGIFRGHPEQHNGADSLIPVDIYIPGCPPHPLTILDGLLRAQGRIQ